MRQWFSGQPGRPADRTRPPFYRLVWVQLALSLGIALIAYIAAGSVAGYSALFGGLIYAVPNALFARQVFAYRPAKAIGRIVRSFYWGEVVKLSLTSVLFSAVFIWARPLEIGVLFFAFILVMITNLLAPALWGSHSLQNKA
ncbi:ATP synthase subunit I [Marinobacter subterrani]|uniref:FoF1-type ATP synthase assembly protein I n=1 Tax=Marinobacter subterrani TaxID=1658765 RepID=A0A0J7JGT9_9GAMM|nr:ATP synthase subunit I [Marinobacter subterrani]KMQ76946.1 FoF1-type ATP synthase assembly protein I [Marinobacter subterrani]